MSSTTAVSLKSGDSVAYAVTLLKKNAITQADVIGHFKSNPTPLGDLESLQGLIPMSDLFAIVAAQRDMESNRAGYKLSLKVWRTDTTYTRNGKNKEKLAPAKGKGNVGVYGLQQMPVTLYPAQWEALLSFADEIRAAIAANRDALSFGKSAE